jgi:hypothetical protein
MRISSGLHGRGRLGVLFVAAGVLAAGCGSGSIASATPDANGSGGAMTAPDGAAGRGGGGGGGGGVSVAGSSGGPGGESGKGVGGSAGASGGAAGGTSGGVAGGIGGGAAGSTADAGPSDSGSASSGCAGKTYKLCEDFESGAAGAIPTGWTALRGYAPTRGGTVLATDAAHSGKMALKSDGMSTGLDRVQRSFAGLGATITKHWGRLFYKVGSPAPVPKTGVIHLTLGALEGTTENRVVDTVVAMSGSHQWLFNIPDDSCCAGSPYNWKFDADWHCAEWSIDVATSSFRFFTDGQEVTQLTFMGKTGARMSTYTSFGLGTIYYQAPPAPIVVWFDDLAIDDNRVGCQ